jgi:enamine deaminase RidA (YjgF/YER057c/UK114 family)
VTAELLPGLAPHANESWDSPVQSTLVPGREAAEAHICARPRTAAVPFGQQARSMYEALAGELRAMGSSPRHVVAEKVFLQDIEVQSHQLLQVRAEMLRLAGGSGQPRPALTLVQQPPARPGQMCEVQALAFIPARGKALTSRGIPGLPAGCSGRVVEMEGAKHVFLSGITGGVPGDDSDFERQAGAMFLSADRHLGLVDLTFRNVVRTWIYVKDIDAEYGILNLKRRQYFVEHGIEPSPASTGIKGTTHLTDRACGLDLRAIVGEGRVAVRPVHAPTLNEAPSYGSDFSRGTRVDLQGRSIIYLSGTASIDTGGCIVAPRDIEGQVERMLVNVEALLAGQGATRENLVSAVTYLKRPEYIDTLRSVCRRRGLPERFPNTICVADICRFEWLCEMEAIAILA